MLEYLPPPFWVRDATNATAITTTPANYTDTGTQRWVKITAIDTALTYEIGNSVTAPATAGTGSSYLASGQTVIERIPPNGTPDVSIRAYSSSGNMSLQWGR